MMWDAEIQNFTRFANRGRLILVSTTALLGFVSAIAMIAKPGADLSETTGLTYLVGVTTLSLGFLLIALGLYGLIRAASIYVNHGEEDAGSLPNPVHFGEIGDRWWVTQPTIDSIEERYLLALCVRRLSWVRGKSTSLTRARMRLSRWRCESRVRRARDRLADAFRENPQALRVAKGRYRRLLKYGAPDPPGSKTFEPEKDRGPRDMASMYIAIKILQAMRERGRVHPREILDHVCEDARTYTESIRTESDDSAHDISKLIAGSTVYNEDKQIYNLIRHEFDKPILDMLHPKTMIRSSSYYLQFSEAFGWTYGGRKLNLKKEPPNPTGSGRPFSELDPDSTHAAAAIAGQRMNEIQWRVFTSQYFAAQDLRSSNWNLWFRVKRAERRFLMSFWLIFCSFVMLALSEGVISTNALQKSETLYRKIDQSRASASKISATLTRVGDYHSGPPE